MSEKETKKSWWPFRSARNHSLVDRQLVTNVPMEVVVRKLHGVIADHSAKITSTGEDHLFMEVAGEQAGSFRRAEDRPIPFLIEMDFKEERVHHENAYGLAAGDYVQTRVHVVIRPKKDRDRRRQQAAERARNLLNSVKSYLMAKEDTGLQQPAVDQGTGVDVGEPQYTS